MMFLQERKAARALRTLRGRRRTGALSGLEDTPLFRGLSKRDLALLARRADHVRFAEGDVVVSEHYPHSQFIVLTSGAAESTMGGHRVGVLGPGDHFGELTLLDGEPQVPTVTALTDLEGFVLARREFWSVLYAIPALSIRLAVRVAEDLRRAHQRLGTEPAEAC